jgi:uncharacterized protein
VTSKRKRLNRELLDAVVKRDAVRACDLLAQGADVNARDAEHNETPLILAARFADAVTLRRLLNAGADLESQDDQGRTTLFFAPILSEAFTELIRAGASIHARDAEGNTILLSKVAESPSLGEVERLLQLGIDASLRNNDGQTALDVAESLGLVKIIEMLRASTSPD